MIAEIGHFSLILALMIAVAQAVVPQIGARRRDGNLMAFASHAAMAQFLFVALAMAALMQAFAVTDLSVAVVAGNSNAAMPLRYRLSATWGNHEGSLLLWVLILSAFGASVAAFGRELPASLKARTLSVQGAIAAAFLGLSLLTTNPFARLDAPPPETMELNPLLQDFGLIVHPPFLYLGYVGFSIVFSFAVAALIEGRVDDSWARMVRPWILMAWIFLTIGITLGSYWAYYELGWGGWWFWDPVENASFMPWLVGTALLHSAIVVERRQTLVVWTVMLAILTFSLSLVGTFVVRSGVITSVHAFASDPARGVGVLAILTAFTGGALVLFALRARDFDSSVSFLPVSREGGLILNNILLVVAAATVFLGTFYPLLVELTGSDRISVGQPYYNRSFVPLMVPLMLALPLGPFLRWKRDRLGEAVRRLRWVAVICLALLAGVVARFGLAGVGTLVGLGLALWLVVGAVAILAVRVNLFRSPWRRSVDLARTTRLAVLGMVLAHAGLGLLVAGLTCVTTWKSEAIVNLAEGQSVQVGGYDFTLVSVVEGAAENYQSETGTISVSRNGQPVVTEIAERRFYPVSGTVTTEAGIKSRLLTNLYVSMGGPGTPGTWVTRIYVHPLVLLIWIGPLVMALGGLLSLADRRLRMGALRLRFAKPAEAAK